SRGRCGPPPSAGPRSTACTPRSRDRAPRPSGDGTLLATAPLPAARRPRRSWGQTLTSKHFLRVEIPSAFNLVPCPTRIVQKSKSAPGSCQVAGDAVARTEDPERRGFHAAARLRDRTARVEAASRRNDERARRVAGQDRRLPGHRGVRRRNPRLERARVWMEGSLEQRVGRRFLDDLAQVHHGHTTRYLAHHRERGRDDKGANPERPLK